MEEVLCFKLKIKGNLFTEGLSKEDLIALIRQSSTNSFHTIENGEKEKYPKSYNPHKIRIKKSSRSHHRK